MLPPKLRGDMAEMLFLYQCACQGLRASRPYGDSFPYDFLVEIGTTAWRVQVKGCNEPSNKGRYRVNSCHTGVGRCYHKDEIDFLACYIFRAKAWHIIPQALIQRRTAVHLFAPRLSHKGHFADCFEAWHLLKQPRPCRFCLQACAETDYTDATTISLPENYLSGEAIDPQTLDLQGCTCH